jgi:hypothetical protein
MSLHRTRCCASAVTDPNAVRELIEEWDAITEFAADAQSMLTFMLFMVGGALGFISLILALDAFGGGLPTVDAGVAELRMPLAVPSPIALLAMRFASGGRHGSNPAQAREQPRGSRFASPSD